MKKNIGSVLALYPTPVVVVGTMIEKKPNWMLVAHIGIIGHDKILLSCAKQHYTNQGIRENGVLSVNLVNEEILPQADYVGSVSGTDTDKSDIFPYLISDCGVPMVENSPLVLECAVDDIYDSEGFDNFILKIQNTYAEESILKENGKIDYQKLSPVLFDMPNYEYLRTGDVIGSCLKLEQTKEVQKSCQ